MHNLAAGTGLARLPGPVTVLVCARCADEIDARGMRSWWHARHRNFRYLITLTREEREGYLHGRVAVVLPRLLPDRSRHSVFAAGCPEFVDSCVARVRQLGAQDALIHGEGFFRQSTAADDVAGLSFVDDA